MEKQIEINLDNLSREEQKVIIAQDVINSIEAKKYIANPNKYIEYTLGTEKEGHWALIAEYATKDVKSNWEVIKECRVCALGACILSITKYKNTLSFNELPEGKQDWRIKQRNHITSVFTPEELAIIELMFEGNSYNKEYRDDLWDYYNVGRDDLGAQLTKEQIKKAKVFYDNHSGETARLIAIMQLIIDNKGELIL